MYVNEGWRIFARTPSAYVLFAWGCLLTGFAGMVLLFFLAQITQNTILIGVASVASLLMAPALLMLIIAGTVTATWAHVYGIPHSFWSTFADRELIGRILLCGLVIGLCLLIYSKALSWIVMLFAGSLLGSDSQESEARAFLFGALIAFLYPGVNWTFTPLLILDRRLGIWNAIQASWDVIGRGWWGMLLLDLIVLLPVALLWILIWRLPLHPLVQGILSFLLLGPSLAVAGSILSIAYADIFGLVTPPYQKNGDRAVSR